MPVQTSDFPIPRSQLIGCSEAHVDDMPNHSGIKMHRDVIAPLVRLIADAQRAGFDLRIASGYRGFERQRLIWNKKCVGERPVLDRAGLIVDLTTLTAVEKIEAILHWSALPGASRHHWGTECDIYDAAAMPEGYQLGLHPSEYSEKGLFAPMMDWLQGYLHTSDAPDFYRPYAYDHGGVAPEPWHVSYRPIASEYEQQFSLVCLKEHLQQLSGDHRIEEQQTVIEHLDTIFQRFISLNYPN
jgi:LAS superfamily LD-carboxypeptidase LdcB